MLRKMTPFDKRKLRVRRTLARRGDRPRLSVFRSSKHIYAQLIDDARAATVVAASSLEKGLKTTLKTGLRIRVNGIFPAATSRIRGLP